MALVAAALNVLDPHNIAAFTAHTPPIPNNVTTASSTQKNLVENQSIMPLGSSSNRPYYSIFINGEQRIAETPSHVKAISSIPTARDSYDLLVNTYNTIRRPETKDQIVLSLNKIFTEHFSVINSSSDVGAVTNAYNNIFELKKLLDVQFAKDVNCKYMFFGSTPVSYGCDLRELIYNRDGTVTQNGQPLLALFQNIANQYLIHNKGKKDIHPLSDIDDTCYANPMHGVAIAGIDRSWLPHKPYPGIKELHNQLRSLPNSSRYATIVSATPGAAKLRKLKDPVLTDIFGVDFAFIQGEESKLGLLTKGPSIIETVVKGGNHSGGAFYTGIGNIKLRRIIEYANIFPERNFIWFGDNGQADEWVGSELLRLYPGRYTVCIHIVKQSANNEPGILYFTSYSELAHKLQDIGIFSPDNVVAVEKGAYQDCRQPDVDGVTEDQRRNHCPPKQTRRKHWYNTGGSTTSLITRKQHKRRRTLKSPIRNNKKYTIRRRQRQRRRRS